MRAGFDDLVVTKWGARFQGRRFCCAVGRGGIGVKRGEGDGITPLGTYRLGGVGYRSDRVSFDAPALDCWPINLVDIWSDDPRDPWYNQEIRARSHRFSHEKLRRADPLYDIFAIVDYNWPDAKAGAGSAIFLHKWRKPRHPTEGCIAFDELDLVEILSGWTERSRLIIR
ncbi:MAG: L,D-transpeptidase family protein [Rhodobacteraceae bacterium]|nr:L,D-transpeptidase family protein [Paracoccaceae bacterium]